MKFKLFIAGLLSIALIFTLTSCFESTTTPDPDPTAAPAGVTATAGDGVVTVSWTAAAAATGYKIYWATDGSVDATDPFIADTASPYQHTGLTNGTTYSYRVSAVRTAGDSGLSAMVSATPTIDITTCDVQDLVDEAYASLENTMYTYTQDSFEPDRPSDIDFSAPRNLYQDAYDCDNANLDARMGLALTDLLAVMMDADVNAAFDLWDAYLSENTPFETDPAKSGGRPLGVNLGLPTNGSALELPFDIVTYTVLANVKTMLDGSDPQLSGIQDILLEVVLPKVVNAIALMTPVAASNSYTLTVSGRMQGDLLEDAVEVDKADFNAMLAMCRLMVGAITAATSYSIDFPTYDGAGIVAALNQTTGSFLTIRPGMSTEMGDVPQLFLDAFDDVEAAANALLAETDDQDNDLIRRGLDDVSIDDINDLLDDVLPKARALFTAGGYTFSEDFDDDPLTADQDLTIDLHAFFSTPITDMKAMVPPYTVSSEVRPCGWHWEYNDEYYFGTPNLLMPDGVNGPVYMHYGVPIQDGEITDTWPDWQVPAFNGFCAAAVASILAEWSADPLWQGNGMIMFWAEANAVENTSVSVDVYGQLEKETVDAYMYIPVLTFTAANFDTWIGQFPDASMNGLMPDMQTGQDIVDFFGIDSEGWEPTMYIEWFGCSNDNGPQY